MFCQKRYIVWFSLLSAGFALLLSLSGCGLKGRSGQKPVQQDAPSPLAQALNLKVHLGLADDIRFPDRSERGLYEGEKDRLVSGTKISFLKPIAFLDLKTPVFFVWEETVFGSPIQMARYEIWKQTPTGQVLGTPEAKFAERDRESRRWFIPLSSILGSRLEDIDPAVICRIVLDLVLSDGNQVSIQVYFSGIGVLPHLAPKNLERIIAPFPGAAAFIEKMKISGLGLAREKYENPFDRPVTFWLRFSNPQTLRFQTLPHIARYPSVVDHPSKMFASWFHYESVARATISEIQIEYPGKPETLITLIEGIWTPVEVAPHSEIIVTWIARVVSGTPQCLLPPPEHQVSVFESDREPGLGRERGFLPRGIKREFDMAWNIGAARLSGQWTHEARVSDTPKADPEILQNGKWPRVEVALQKQTTEEQIGVMIPIGTHAGPWGCQGMF